MVTKSILRQYANLLQELDEVKHDIDKLDKEIARLEQRLAEIEDGEIVKDRVYGGEGGIQGFNIEGIPTSEYDRDVRALWHSKLVLESRQARLRLLQWEIKDSIDQVNEFMASIDDSFMRRLISYRVVKQLTWEEVAAQMGGGNTAESVRKMFRRFIGS